jgi:hypothetical protein
MPIRPPKVYPLSPAQIFSQLLAGRVQLIPALSQLSPALGNLLAVLTNLSPIPADLFSARAITNILAQLGSILFQLFNVLLHLLAIFSNVFASFANVSYVPANFPSIGIATPVIYAMAMVIPPRGPAVVNVTRVIMIMGLLVVSPVPVPADEHGALRELTAQHLAISGCRLMAWGSARIPDPAFTRRWEMTARNMQGMTVTLSLPLMIVIVVVIRHRGHSGND